MQAKVEAPGSLIALLAGFRGRVGRGTYAAVGFGLMIVKFGVDAALVYARLGVLWTPLDYLNPVFFLRQETLGPEATGGFQLAMAAWTLPFLWIGVSMTLRRAYDAGMSAWTGLLFFVPLVNYCLMLILCVRPSVEREQEFELLGGPAPPPIHPSIVSALIAVGISVVASAVFVLLSVYGLGSYGVALFAGSPFLLGVVAGYLYNRGEAQSLWATFGVVTLAIALSSMGMMLFALEGAICIAMAAPLALVVAVLGGAVGRGLALVGREPAYPSAFALAALPFLGWIEAKANEPGVYRVDTAIEVDAPPEVVWLNVVSFADLPPPHEWLFRVGIAYPKRARIEGSGVGAVRHCEFSTGAFVEPITVWDEPRRLAFDVIAQPPPMKEWSPYHDLHPPHLDGYLRSKGGEFRLIPIDGGRRTRLEGTTWYELELHPTGYWRLWTDTLIHRIHTRVLRHVATLSE